MWGGNNNQGQGWNGGQQPNQGWSNQPNQGFNGGQQPNQGWNGQQNQGWNGQQNQGWNQNQGFNGGQQPNQGWNGQQNQGFNGGGNQGWNGGQNSHGHSHGHGHHGHSGNHGQNQGFNALIGNFLGHNTNPWANKGHWGNNGISMMPTWGNPFNVFVPPIMFGHNCKKCHGSGMMNKHGTMIPCRRCYKKNGICAKCYGGGFNYLNGKPCKKCQGGHWKKRHGHRSSSSSSSG